MQEKATMFIFLLYHVPPVCVNKLSVKYIFFSSNRVNYVCVKECTA